ncbi:hypothetical protein [Geodermatophilus sp. SYSU D00766]
MDTLTVLANVSQVVGLLIAVAATVIAIKALDIANSQLTEAVSNTRSSKKAAEDTQRSTRGQFILAIDAAFRAYDQVRAAINNTSVANPGTSDLYRYIAVFERLGYLIEWSLIDPQTVDDLYGDRFSKLLEYYEKRNMNFPPQVRPESWWGFIVLWHHLRTMRQLPEPPHVPAARAVEPNDSDSAP